ncbi:ABC-type antimicrobial peptide transport system, ATPase component [Brachybacterium faecium DSM 4810]|uniref:ABC-type antimicrobial peptide transport system, ATPase component n=1 Tax=Brachybacterium faecium (strain ATCC 43885 / DSM 4810 / JCM 11609 / LMG 19847 / NBRC 14762 / NCIMB 9860 / 6-10) TaxID=446465 RepID=C7MF12_BRAFD|nr:ABC transporter ATP-binding protein [Brachybacterium faecium]ACU83912.1 ABC-type antimicrobial peptide transport system, ATPase component [Brachybacterium faecium DSM 4810]
MTTTATTSHTHRAIADGATSALRLDGVSVTYPDGRHADGTIRTTTALDDAHLTLGRGEFSVVLGPSGSGKSTLLSVAAGLVVPDAGKVFVDGTDLTALDETRRTEVRRDQIGVVFQQPNLLPALRVREQLMVSAHLAGLRGRRLRATRERADELLERVGMQRYAARRPHELSGGQRQRVNIARALFTDPAVLLVDEPTSALDHERARSVVDLLVGVTRELSVATVMVTHDHEFAEDADRVVTLRDGRVQADR